MFPRRRLQSTRERRRSLRTARRARPAHAASRSNAATGPHPARPARSRRRSTTAAATGSTTAPPAATRPTTSPATAQPPAARPTATPTWASPGPAATGGYRVHPTRRPPHSQAGWATSAGATPTPQPPAGLVAGTRTPIGTVESGTVGSSEFDASVLAFPGRSTGSHRVCAASAAGAVHRGAQATGGTRTASPAPT